VSFWLLAAAVGPKVVSAGVDPLASPTPRPTERITAPVISGVNPDAVLSEGNLGDNLPSGSFDPVGIALPAGIDPPLYVELISQSASHDNALFDLSRNVEDVNCGPASLSQALKLLDPEEKSLLPTTNQLSDFMTNRGLMYEWGTGVEELVYTAREFGYDGSITFQDWGIEKLTEYLHRGRPLIVSLGINGADRPGHFVTLTGISGDGKWITFQDPAAGESIMSREEFQTLWELQGSAGMIPQKKSSTVQADPMLPWMGLFGVISALALTLNQSFGLRESKAFALLRKQLSNSLRKGIGAGPLPPKDPDVITVPRYETKTVYRGIKKEEVEIPIYETRKVKVGIREIKKKVPQYETRRVQIGVESVPKRIPIYKTKKVQTGTKLVKKEIPVTRYKTKKVMVWKKYTKRVPIYRSIGSKKIVIGYKNETRWKRIPVTKQIPYQTTKTISIQVPLYKEIRVVSGYKNVTESVPKFGQKQVLAGHKIINETVPIFEDREVQVGTKTVTREMPQYEMVRVVVGYDEIQNFQEKPLNDVEQKMKLICEDQKIQELANEREFEFTNVVYLKGGPGAGSGMEKVEKNWSGYTGGGSGGSTWWMLLLKLISRALVWVRDSTKILEGSNRKPDAQAIIMYSGGANDKKIDDIVIINKGNEPIIVRYINVKNTQVISPSEGTYIQVYPYTNMDGNIREKEAINPGDYQIFTIHQSIELSPAVVRTLLVQLSTPSNRAGFLIYELSKQEK